jgi:hypothetical protein
VRKDSSGEGRAPRQPARPDDMEVLLRIREALEGLRYGEVTIIVQDGVVVQVERTEKLRLPRD